MASGSGSSPSIDSAACRPKRKSNDVGWEFCVCPDPKNYQVVKCTLCGKVMSGGVTRLKQHIAQIIGQVSACPKATKDDQLKCRDALNEGKNKKKDKKEHDKAIRSEARFNTNISTINEDDEVHDSLGSRKEPNVFGPMDNSCQVNNERYDPAHWWGNFGGATPNLKKIAMRILALTSSSSGCERNWSTFEGIHTKKRNRLEASKLNNLVYCQFNSNLMEKNNRRKDRNIEVLLSNDANMAQEWVAECDEDGNEEDEAHWEAIGEAIGADEFIQPRQSSRTTAPKAAPKATQRELFDEDFQSESEEIVYDEGEYDSDGVQIRESCGD